jgi:hypothetical protein
MDSELQQIVERIRGAAADATPLRIRGGGTKDFHGVPASTGVPVLDTRALAGITAYEPSELVVTVRAGTPLAELEAALAAEGQCLPFEPPHFGVDGAGGTVGGMVAAGWSGPARASVGAVRDYVLGVQLVDGRGEVLSFGGQVMKNVAGYDVSRVLAGSFGTLGVIAEVSLKVLPVAPAEATLRFECTQAEAIDLLNGWGGRPLPLNASCWVEDAGRGTLYLRLRGAVAAVEAARAPAVVRRPRRRARPLAAVGAADRAGDRAAGRCRRGRRPADRMARRPALVPRATRPGRALARGGEGRGRPRDAVPRRRGDRGGRRGRAARRRPVARAGAHPARAAAGVRPGRRVRPRPPRRARRRLAGGRGPRRLTSAAREIASAPSTPCAACSISPAGTARRRSTTCWACCWPSTPAR